MGSHIVKCIDNNLKCYKHKLIEVPCDVLELDTNTDVRWIEHDNMNANQSKFRGIILGKDVSQSMEWLKGMIPSI